MTTLAQYDQQLGGLDKKKQSYEGLLQASSSAIGGSASPTDADVSNEVRLNQLKTKISNIQNKRIQQYWFGTDQRTSDSKEGAERGPIGTVLDVVSRPLYGVVGAAKHVVGNGTGTLSQDITKNIMEDRNTFSDLLSQGGMSYSVAAPLGFALDIAFDPVNWATAGTTALLPRIAAGAVSGAAKGGVMAGARAAGLGATSSLGRKALYAGRFLGAGKTKTFEKAASAVSKQAAEYDSLIGRNFDDIIKQTGVGFGSQYRMRLGDMIEEAANKIPGGAAFYKQFKYDNADWMRLARIQDSVKRALGVDAEFKSLMRAYLDGQPIDEFLSKSRTPERIKAATGAGQADELFDPHVNWDSPDFKMDDVMDKKLQEIIAGTEGGVDTWGPRSEAYVRNMNDAIDILDNPHFGTSTDPVENAMRIASEELALPADKRVSLADLKQLADSGAFDETGVRWFDKTMDGVRSFKIASRTNKDKVYEVGKNILNTYKAHIDFFKLAKVAGSASAWTNAVLGNITMAFMAGLNVTDPAYLKAVKDANAILRGWSGSQSALTDLLNAGEMAKFMKENPSTFARTFGMSPDFVQSKYFAETVLRKGRELGIVGKDVKNDDVLRMIEGVAQDLNEIGVSAQTRNAAQEAIHGARGVKATTPMEYARSIHAMGEIPTSELPTSFIGSELSNSQLKQVTTLIEKKAADPGANPIYKVLKYMFNKPVEGLEALANGYERIDQTNKLGLTLYATRNGLTEGEINILRRSMDLTDGIASKVQHAGETRYKLTGAKATELANEVFLNYAAMPGAVRVLRNMPLLGNPFAAFMYGMMLKTGKTMVTNPAVFNKVSFMLHDFGGSKGPIEKKALEDPRYKYLNDPTMLRLPFFTENPMYVNLANLLPYYTLNIFNPSERKYDQTLPSALSQMIDKTPLFKDPYGQIIFDYMVQPLILREALPQSAFGQPVYPAESTPLQRFGYATRALAETVTPGMIAPTGVVMPESIAEALPGYRWRQLARAAHGKNIYGMVGRESALSRTLRGMVGWAGIPLQAPVDLSYTSSQYKDK